MKNYKEFIVWEILVLHLLYVCMCLHDAWFGCRIIWTFSELVKFIKFHNDIFRVCESRATVRRVKGVWRYPNKCILFLLNSTFLPNGLYINVVYIIKDVLVYFQFLSCTYECFVGPISWEWYEYIRVWLLSFRVLQVVGEPIFLGSSLVDVIIDEGNPGDNQ